MRLPFPEPPSCPCSEHPFLRGCLALGLCCRAGTQGIGRDGGSPLAASLEPGSFSRNREPNRLGGFSKFGCVSRRGFLCCYALKWSEEPDAREFGIFLRVSQYQFNNLIFEVSGFPV